ncbi:MAG: hypothetical protein NC900_06270 [Candidatus Omnitrophica bacterium]|nr:hypothetical protein [Candidatus Omnitrophota bacterium]
MKRLFYLIILFFNLVSLSFAQTPPISSQILKTEEDIQKEKILRKKLESEEKFYIKKITFEGIVSIEPKDLEEVKSLFEKRWLTKEEINKIFDALRDIYLAKNLNLPSDIQYTIKKRHLIIKVKEE